MEEKIYVFIVDPDKENKRRAPILQVLSREVKCVPNALRQNELHKIVGCSIRARYFKYILETMEEEGLVMQHWRPYTEALAGGYCWALWDHPENIRLREWWEQCEREEEANQIAWENSPAGKAEQARIEAEQVREAQERFNSKLSQFVAGNEDEIFNLIQRIYVAYMAKNNCIHSRHTYLVPNGDLDRTKWKRKTRCSINLLVPHSR